MVPVDSNNCREMCHGEKEEADHYDDEGESVPVVVLSSHHRRRVCVEQSQCRLFELWMGICVWSCGDGISYRLNRYVLVREYGGKNYLFRYPVCVALS